MNSNEPDHDYSITLYNLDETKDSKTVFVKHSEDLYDYLDAIKTEYVFGKGWSRVVIELSDSCLEKLKKRSQK
tara:strand:- start:264 stop:482 length:219 start_codon:yes stop_codon:yes gene_type:complete